MKIYDFILLMKLNRDELFVVIKYYSYMNDKFICDLHLYDTDELRKLVKYYDIDVDEDIDEELLKIAVEWYDEKQLVINNKNIIKKLQGFLCF
jgi:hypothetical protein